MKSFRRRLKLLAIPVVLAVTVGGVALGQGGSAPNDEGGDATALDRPRTAEVAPELANAFAVLRRPATAADAIPDRYNGVLGARNGSMSTTKGANPDLARRVSTLKDGAAYFVPGDKSGCLVTVRKDAYAGTCADLDQVVRQGTFIGSAASDMQGRRLEGLAPDGVVGIRIERYERPEVDVPVRNNTYAVEYGGLARTIELLDSKGSVVGHFDIEEAGAYDVK